MPDGCRAPGTRRIPRLAGAVLALSAVILGATSCAGQAGRPPQASRPPAARTRPPAAAASVLAGPPAVVAADAARQLFAAAPEVVVADADRPAGVAAAASRAGRARAPLLLASPQAGPGSAAALRAGIRGLDARTVLADGSAGGALVARLPGIRVLTAPARLPEMSAPAPLGRVVLLVHRGDSGAAATAAVTTARAAGVRVIAVRGYDPQADPAAVAALAAARPRQVVAVGPRFGPVSRLEYRLGVAETGEQLPGGGQILFPQHRLVALYGHPGTPALGALGQQGLSASIARAEEVARRYRRLSRVPVIPAFEIIATVAEAGPGPDGSYSYESSVASLRPWVQRATAAGMYVVLDLQAGRASLLAQARKYQPLLERPDVGLALDPEWKLAPQQVPLRQIGSVTSGQVNAVSQWLAGLTARHRLPQKLLVLHQFRLSMIRDEQRLDTRHGDLAIVIHMDGQGTPKDKQQTWDAVTRAAPRGVFFGWKNFYAKDHPMLSPRDTMARAPEPVMVSYQ